MRERRCRGNRVVCLEVEREMELVFFGRGEYWDSWIIVLF